MNVLSLSGVHTHIGHSLLHPKLRHSCFPSVASILGWSVVSEGPYSPLSLHKHYDNLMVMGFRGCHHQPKVGWWWPERIFSIMALHVWNSWPNEVSTFRWSLHIHHCKYVGGAWSSSNIAQFLTSPCDLTFTFPLLRLFYHHFSSFIFIILVGSLFLQFIKTKNICHCDLKAATRWDLICLLDTSAGWNCIPPENINLQLGSVTRYDPSAGFQQWLGDLFY